MVGFSVGGVLLGKQMGFVTGRFYSAITERVEGVCPVILVLAQ